MTPRGAVDRVPHRSVGGAVMNRSWSVVGVLAVAFNLSAAPVPPSVLTESRHYDEFRHRMLVGGGRLGEPGNRRAEYYFPTKVGAKWIYELNGEEYTEVVTSVKQNVKGQGRVVAVGRLNKAGKVTPDTEWEVSDRGLVLIQRADDEEVFARRYLELPHRPDAKWCLSRKFQTMLCLAIKPERVKVPAGEYDAIGVELYFGTLLEETRWYALGVGLVKQVDAYGKTALVLKSFTPG